MCDEGALAAVRGESPKAWRDYGAGEQRRNAAEAPRPSGLRVKKRVCCVARLANIPDIRRASRFASIAF